MDMPRSCFGLKSDFDFYESFIHKRKRSIRFPAVEFYNSSTITALENQFSSITDFSRTIKCSKLALRVTLLVCGAVKKKHTSGPINGVQDTFSENPLDVAFAVLQLIFFSICPVLKLKVTLSMMNQTSNFEFEKVLNSFRKV